MLSTLFAAATAAAATAATAATKAVPTGLKALPSALPLTPEQRQQLLNFQLGHKAFLASNYPWLTHTFAFFAVACAAALVVLLAFQTTKQEGLSGTIGGRVESNYRPRLGFDQQLQRITTFIALAFVVFATVVSISGI